MNIILPEDEKDGFEYFELITLALNPVKTAMVKFPDTLREVFTAELEESEESQLIWYVAGRQEEVDANGENPASRYELRGSVYVAPESPPVNTAEEALQMMQEFFAALESNFQKDGYVYIPKATRDGNHEDHYILNPIPKNIFTTRTERGMFEEVAWSPFGSIDEATKQEATNLERNPLMRNWI